MAGSYNRLEMIGNCARCGGLIREGEDTSVTVNGVSMTVHGGCV